ncbi:MAG: hypothetical protein M1818_006527 [Claussenomyces sp. TS43310]|nr:MAG: hypothetical protein M1818_006527 [Claussenomyces sp. TS43310]
MPGIPYSHRVVDPSLLARDTFHGNGLFAPLHYEEPSDLALSGAESSSSLSSLDPQDLTLNDSVGPSRSNARETDNSLPKPVGRRPGRRRGSRRRRPGRTTQPCSPSVDPDETNGFTVAQTRYIILLRAYEALPWYKIAPLMKEEFDLGVVGRGREPLTLLHVRRRYASALLGPGTERRKISDEERERRVGYRTLKRCLDRVREDGGKLQGLSEEGVEEIKGWMERVRERN